MPQQPNNPTNGRPINRVNNTQRKPVNQGGTAKSRPSVTYIYDFFISYSFVDRESTELLCEHLERRGYKCFMAHRDIPKGTAFAQMIPWAVEKSRVMITMLTKNFDASAHTSREVSLATESAMPVITIRMEDCELTGLKKYYLRDINWIDATGDVEKSCDDIESTYKRLAESNPTRIPTAAPRKAVKGYKRSNVPTIINIGLVAILAVLVIVLFKKLSKTEIEMLGMNEKIQQYDSIVAQKSSETIQDVVSEIEPMEISVEEKNITNEDKEKIRYNKLIAEIRKGGMDFSNPQKAAKNIEKLEELISIIERNSISVEEGDGDSLRVTTENGVKVSKSEWQKARLQFVLGKLYYYNIGTRGVDYRRKTESYLKNAYEKIPEAGLYLCLNDIRNVNYVNNNVMKSFAKGIIDLYGESESITDKGVRAEIEYYYYRSAVLCRKFQCKVECDDTNYIKGVTPFRESIEKKYMTNTNTLSNSKK